MQRIRIPAFFVAATYGIQWSFALPCPIRAATGWACPGCGGTHAAVALFHGRLSEAVDDNLALVAIAPIAGLLGILWVVGTPLPDAFRHPRVRTVLIATAIALLIGWTVARNIPALHLSKVGG